MKTKMLHLVLFLAVLNGNNICIGQKDSDEQLAVYAYRELNKASISNGITSALGLASNIEMAAIGGFPMEDQVDPTPGIILSHMCLGIGRWIFSIPPPVLISKARRDLQPWRESPAMASENKRLFTCLDAAQILTTIAPLLSVSGGIMMFTASAQYSYTYDEYGYHGEYKMKHPALKTAGWIFVSAGLAASISGSVLIGLSKKELSRKMGTLKVSASPGGVGLIYNLPASTTPRF